MLVPCQSPTNAPLPAPCKHPLSCQHFAFGYSRKGAIKLKSHFLHMESLDIGHVVFLFLKNVFTFNAQFFCTNSLCANSKMCSCGNSFKQGLQSVY